MTSLQKVVCRPSRRLVDVVDFFVNFFVDFFVDFDGDEEDSSKLDSSMLDITPENFSQSTLVILVDVPLAFAASNPIFLFPPLDGSIPRISRWAFTVALFSLKAFFIF